MTRVDIRPELLIWAVERAGLSQAAAAKRFPKFPEWRSGRLKPTLKQLEGFAKATHTPVGFLFLIEPPVETVPLPDFRTIKDRGVHRPSADLLDTIYICQQRQEWYREYARSTGEAPLPFVGSVRLGADVVATAASISEVLGFDLDQRRRTGTWEKALDDFLNQADELGILVMRNGVVLNNTKRKLDPDEFRGFAMADPLAPVIFINGADTKSAQMFTLAHELVHIWLGQSALSNAWAIPDSSHDVERWSNEVAAEILVPLAAFRQAHNPIADQFGEMQRLANQFKVSTLVILRRMYDAGRFTREEFWDAFAGELGRVRALVPKGGGGDFHRTEAIRVSKRFARALLVSTLEGNTLYRDTFRMLGFSKEATFRSFAQSLGVLA